MNTSDKAARFTESVIREMTRIFNARGDRPGANLGQGFPDFPAPLEMKEAACRAIMDDINQYAIPFGSKNVRSAIADKTALFHPVRPNEDTEITVTCGATEAMISALLALVNPGEEVIVFEPFYENYGPDAILSGAKPSFVSLRAPDWRFDEGELRAAFNDRTRAIIINTPNNPTGKVYSREELNLIAELCQKWNAWAVTDEIYEHIVYDREHLSMADLAGMRDRTITISGLSKTYSATGWRIGWIIAPAEATAAIRKVHDFLTVGAAAPLQEGAAVALRFPKDYYEAFDDFYRAKRDFTCEFLQRAGYQFSIPQGAYYVMADFSSLSNLDDISYAKWLIEEVGVATVPGSSFVNDPADGRTQTRFCFCKKQETLEKASDLLKIAYG